MKMEKFLVIFFVCMLVISFNFSYAQEFEELTFFTSDNVYSENQPLFVSGKGIPGENIIVRIFAPDGTITKFDQIPASEDGSFNHLLLLWPEPSPAFPYGTYVVEAISTEQNGLSKSIPILFTSDSESTTSSNIARQVITLVSAPDTAAIGSPLRIFIQTTSDGLLIIGSPEELLGQSRIHLPNGEIQSLSGSFKILQQGLYYVDYTPTQLGTHAFHAITFHQGSVSNSYAVTNVVSQDISGLSEQIIKLDSILDETADELDRLKSEVSEFGSTLESASQNIDSSVGSMSSSVTNIEEASVQLNSLLFPVVGIISITVALQIVILARRR